MSTTTLIILIAAGFAVALAIILTRALTRSSLLADRARLESILDVPGRVEKAVQDAEKAKDAVMAAHDQAHAEALAARDQAHEAAMKTMKEQFAVALGQMKDQAKNATDELLKARQQEFKESSSEVIGHLLNPVKEKMEELRKEMTTNSDVHKTAESAIKSNVENLMKYTGRVARSTDQLAAAFKYGNKLQGTWGETILEELLSSQGLTKGVHFDVQPTITDAEGHTVKNEDGSAMRPDVIIHLDRRREVIVDAKTSLADYVNYVNAENEEDRARYLRAHIESIKKHVKELARKDYASYVQPPKMSAGYVIMFVPNMGALWTALNAEPDLWRWAAEQNVYIADEQSLYGAIRIVQLTWTQVQQAENHEKVYALAGEMMDRVDKFLAAYEDMGNALEKAMKAYTEAGKKLAPSGQSITTTAVKLAKMGARKGKHIERALQDVDDIGALEEGDRE
ncbi:MAG: DNA recombination protein RmuC [Bacteroidales bacterium]|nr:DNA recombination protein RmuC [Bacteroidales bacterium]